MSTSDVGLVSRSGSADDLVLRPSPAWRLFLEDGRVVLSAGADETYVLDELAADEAQELERRWTSGAIDPSAPCTPALATVLALLEKAGALHVARPSCGSGRPLRFAPLAIGAAAQPVVDVLRAMVSRDEALQPVERTDAPDLAVLVRGNGPLLAVLDAAGALADRPHLLIDVGFAHTLSVGPFVWPGRSACLGCFAGRIAHAWGDPDPPQAPRATRAPELAAAMALEQLRSFREHGGCPFLVERVVSLDLATLETRVDHVFRLPWCPRCRARDEEPRGAGSFALPWRAEGLT